MAGVAKGGMWFLERKEMWLRAINEMKNTFKLWLFPKYASLSICLVICLSGHLYTYQPSKLCYFRTTVYWRSKDVDNILKGYKLNLQTAIGSKAPASILNFYFKYTFCRKVGQMQNAAMSKN